MSIGNSAGSENPKDAVGKAKVPLHLWPATATAAGAVGLYEGELKYGRNNFRGTEVLASVYVAAAKRHIDAWFEGGGDSHLGNALASLAILVDTAVNGTMVDDRNYTPSDGAYDAFALALAAHMAVIREQFGHLTPKHWDARDNRVTGAFDSNQATTFGAQCQEEMPVDSLSAKAVDQILDQMREPVNRCSVCEKLGTLRKVTSMKSMLEEELRKVFGPDVEIVHITD